MQDEVSSAGWRGQVRIESVSRGVLWEGHNTVVSIAPEIMMAALMGSTSINEVAFGYGGGLPVSPSTRSIPGVLALVPATEKTLGRDTTGRKSIGTWRFTWAPVTPQSYDMLGLLATSGQLFAATNFPRVELQANEAVAVAWTIYLRD